MNPSRILPDLQCSLLCQEVRREANGNFFIIGILDALVVPQLPITALQLCLFNRWTAGLGEFVESARLVAADQTTVLRKTEVRFGLRDPRENATTVSIFSQVEFKTPGTYYVELLVDDVMKLRFPINVFVAPPQNAPPGAPPPA